jgi:4'-phosphopantetheinyl transferase
MPGDTLTDLTQNIDLKTCAWSLPSPQIWRCCRSDSRSNGGISCAADTIISILLCRAMQVSKSSAARLLALPQAGLLARSKSPLACCGAGLSGCAILEGVRRKLLSLGPADTAPGPSENGSFERYSVLNISRSDVHLWYRKTQCLAEDAIIAADRSLSAEERARRDRFHFAADRRDFTIAHDLLRRTLSLYSDVPPADWRFTANKYGKPSIDSVDHHLAALSFSITHTTGWVACGVTLGGALGVDIERTDRSLAVMEIARRCFSEKEAAWLRQFTYEMRRVRFVELWTLKEAYLKATGIGLSGSLAAVSFEFDEPRRILFDAHRDCERAAWHFALFNLGSMTRLAVAARNGNQPHFAIREDGSESARLEPIAISE